MGYSTDFKGVLKFKRPLKTTELSELTRFLGKDRREIGLSTGTVYEDGKYGSFWHHIALEITPDFSGLQWNGSEKTYELEHIVNWLIDKSGVDLQLEGELVAQGEDLDDRWRLVMREGRAVKIDYPKIGQRVTCPCCEETFILEE